METVTISKSQLESIEKENQKLKTEVETLRNTSLYRRLLDCLENLKEKEYTRKDLGI